jgi:pyruvate formate lyase activating enzyme
MPNLGERLARHTRPAELYRKLEGNRVECLACGLRCPVSPGFAGVCKVRFNTGGTLYAPAGYVNSVACDPIEKKPFFHAFPASYALSFGMLGCDLHCGYCQNWITSQALRDYRADVNVHQVTPRGLVEAALRSRARTVVSTYNEPLITSEWAVEVFREARSAGLKTGFVSNGNATPEVLDYLHPWVDLFKVDLKSFQPAGYRQLGGRLAPILDSIQRIHRLGFWLEVVTLVVPGFNDSDGELREMAEFLRSVSPDIPWHVTAFHPDYRMTDPPATPPETLRRAATIGREAGLHFVYTGNLPGQTGDWENTRCHHCGATVVARRGFLVLENRLGPSGDCPDCGAAIPGRWETRPDAHPVDSLLLHPRCG